MRRELLPGSSTSLTTADMDAGAGSSVPVSASNAATRVVPARAARRRSSSSAGSISHHVNSSAASVTLGCLCAFLRPKRVEAWRGSTSMPAMYHRDLRRQAGGGGGQARHFPVLLRREGLSPRWSIAGSVICRSSRSDHSANSGRSHSRFGSGTTSTATMSVMIGSDSGTLEGSTAGATGDASAATTVATASAASAPASSLPDGAAAASKPVAGVNNANVAMSAYNSTLEPSSEQLPQNGYKRDQNGQFGPQPFSSGHVAAIDSQSTAAERPSEHTQATTAMRGTTKPPERQMKDLGKKGRWQEALRVLDGIDLPTERHFLTAMAACEASRQPRQSLRVHASMVAAGFKATPDNLLPVVRGLMRDEDPRTALQVFQQSGFRVQGSSGRLSEDERLREKPTKALQKLYFLAIRATQKLRNWREAVLLYREAELVDPRPVPAAAAAVFNVCYNEKQYATALAFATAALEPPEEEEQRRRVLMNKIIVACGRAGPDQYHKALDVYEQLEHTVGPDAYSLTATIDVLRRLGDWRRALPLLERLAESGLAPEAGLRTSLNAVLAGMGASNYHEAKALVRRARDEWDVRGDVATYGTLILAASEQRQVLRPSPPPQRTPPPLGQSPTRASLTEFYAERRRGEGREVGVVDGARRRRDGSVAGDGGRDTREGEFETVQMLRLSKATENEPSESCLNMSMFNLARSGAWQEATALVNTIASLGIRVSRNQQEALVSALCIGEQWAEALSAVETMLCESVVVDEITASLAVKACAAMGLKEKWRVALNLLRQATRASQKLAENELLGMSTTNGRRPSGRGVALEPEVFGVSPWQRLLSVLASEGLREEAVAVIQEMGALGLAIDEETGTTLVQAAYKVGDFAGAMAWLGRLRHAGLRLTWKGYASCIDACRELGSPEAARRVFDVMVRANVEPTTAVYNAVLGAYCFSFAAPKDLYDRWKREESQRFGPPGDRWVDVAGTGRRDRGDDEGDVVDVNGGGGGGSGVERAADLEERAGEQVEGQGEGGGKGLQRHPHQKSGEWAIGAVEMLKDMRSRDVIPDALTYALVMTALISAERIEQVVSMWKQVLTDPGAVKLRRDVAKHVLGVCRNQGRARLAVQLVQLGAELAGGERGVWPDETAYRLAMTACEREGATAWREAVILVGARNAVGFPFDDRFLCSAEAVLIQGKASGLSGAADALGELSSTREEGQGR